MTKEEATAELQQRLDAVLAALRDHCISKAMLCLEDWHAFATRELAKAAEFKTFVHSYLDAHGVPHGDPANEHQKAGCRIGARLDLLFAQRDEALAACRAALAKAKVEGR